MSRMASLALVLLGATCAWGQERYEFESTFDVPKGMKSVEVDGQKYAIPSDAKGMTLVTRFYVPGKTKPERGVPYNQVEGAKTFRGHDVPKGATLARSVIRFVRPNKRGMADVLMGRRATGNHVVEVPTGSSGAQDPTKRPAQPGQPTKPKPPAQPTKPKQPTQPVKPAKPAPRTVSVTIDY